MLDFSTDPKRKAVSLYDPRQPKQAKILSFTSTSNSPSSSTTSAMNLPSADYGEPQPADMELAAHLRGIWSEFSGEFNETLSSLASVKTAKSGLRTRLDQAEKQAQLLATQLEEKEKSWAQRTETTEAESRASVTKAEADLKISLSEKAKLQKELELAAKAQALVEDKLSGLTKTHQALQLQLKDQEKTLQFYKSGYEMLSKQVNEFQAQLATVKKESLQVQNDARLVEETVKGLTANQILLEERLLSQKAKLASAEEQKQAEEKEREDKGRLLGELREEMVKEKVKNSTLREQVSQLMSSRGEHEEELRALASEKTMLEKEMEKLQGIVGVCRKINMNLDQKVEELIKEKTAALQAQGAQRDHQPAAMSDAACQTSTSATETERAPVEVCEDSQGDHGSEQVPELPAQEQPTPAHTAPGVPQQQADPEAPKEGPPPVISPSSSKGQSVSAPEERRQEMVTEDKELTQEPQQQQPPVELPQQVPLPQVPFQALLPQALLPQAPLPQAPLCQAPSVAAMKQREEEEEDLQPHDEDLDDYQYESPTF